MFGADRPAAVCRELTKTFEEFRRGPLGTLAADYQDKTVKGEIVLVIGPSTSVVETSEEDIDAMLLKYGETLPAARAAAEVASITGLARKLLYQRLLDIRAADAG